jgi:transposase
MSFPLYLSPFTRQQLSRRLQQAYTSGALRLVKRLHALLALAPDMAVCDVAEMLALGQQTVRDYRNQFLWKGMASLVDKRPPGRPSTWTTTPRKPLAEWINARPQASGSTSGCWHTPMMQDLLPRRFGIAYQPHDSCPLWKNMGFSYQKARCVSEHLHEAKRLAWRHTRWPQIGRKPLQRKALRLFGDEASCARWGSLRSTGAPRGQQPDVPTSGQRKADKVFGRIDSFSGRLFSQAHTGRGNSASSAAFWLRVLSHTRQHGVVMQDGARSHTSKAMTQFFEAPVDRLTIEPLPAYSPDFNPIEPLGKKVTKEATHLKYFPAFSHLQTEVDRALHHFAQTPHEITGLMARYCESLGAMAA